MKIKQDPEDVSTSKGIPKTSGKLPWAEREAWDRFSVTDLRRNKAADTLISGFRVQNWGRIDGVALSHPVSHASSQQPWDPCAE